MEDTRRRLRKFYSGAVHHIYQRSKNGYVFAYTVRDYLVISTIFFTVFRKYGIRPMGLCIMPEHIHSLARYDNKSTMSAIMDESISRFVKEFNKYYGTKGALFPKRFGNAIKHDEKKIRTAIAYLYNNPVEKKVADRCEKCRWTFLPYALSTHPFSEELVLNKSSQCLRAAIKEVNSRFNSSLAIPYNVLNRLSKHLSNKEKKQLSDHIISKYNVIDYDSIVQYYGSFEAMILAINSNTGSEYDIIEEKHPLPDTVYPQLYNYLTRNQLEKAFLKLCEDKKQDIARQMFLQTNISYYQIAKFMHLENSPDLNSWSATRSPSATSSLHGCVKMHNRAAGKELSNRRFPTTIPVTSGGGSSR